MKPRARSPVDALGPQLSVARATGSRRFCHMGSSGPGRPPRRCNGEPDEPRWDLAMLTNAQRRASIQSRNGD